jgi:hypothetical protein
MPNPYESPQQANPHHEQPATKLTGWPLAKDTLSLFGCAFLASIVCVPLLFAFFIVLSILWPKYFH